MAGYSIDLLAPAEEVAGSENIAIHEGVTKRAPVSLLDQGKVITQAPTAASGTVRKNTTFVLKNNDADISFTLSGAMGKKKNGNTYEDDAEAAAGLIVKVHNASTRKHYVIHSSSSWSIEAGQTLEFLWSGSAFTLLNPHLAALTVEGAAALKGPTVIDGALSGAGVTGVLSDYYNKHSVDQLLGGYQPKGSYIARIALTNSVIGGLDGAKELIQSNYTGLTTGTLTVLYLNCRGQIFFANIYKTNDSYGCGQIWSYGFMPPVSFTKNGNNWQYSG